MEIPRQGLLASHGVVPQIAWTLAVGAAWLLGALLGTLPAQAGVRQQVLARRHCQRQMQQNQQV